MYTRNDQKTNSRPPRVVLFTTSVRNPFVEAWFQLIVGAGAEAVVLADAECSHAVDVPSWLKDRIVYTRGHGSGVSAAHWRSLVEDALGGPPDTLYYWWGIDLLKNRTARAAWTDAHLSICVDTYPNASVLASELRERYTGGKVLEGVDSVVVTSPRMADMLSSRFRALRGRPMLPILSPFSGAAHYSGASSLPDRGTDERLRLCFTGRADFLHTRSRRMGKDDLGDWLVHLMNNGMDVYVQEPTEEGRRAELMARGYNFYARTPREGLTDGTFATMLSGFDGNLVHYAVVNPTIARRVSNGLSTRFANALCSPCPIIAPTQATFARDLFSVCRVGLCASSPKSIRRAIVELATDFRETWHAHHEMWMGERYGPDLMKLWGADSA